MTLLLLKEIRKLVVIVRDRGEIKWAPFNSVINGKYIVSEIEKKKKRINKPVLSDEQVSYIEKAILEAMSDGVMVDLTFYKEGFLYHDKATILRVDSALKKIYLSNMHVLYFWDIINIKTIAY